MYFALLGYPEWLASAATLGPRVAAIHWVVSSLEPRQLLLWFAVTAEPTPGVPPPSGPATFSALLGSLLFVIVVILSGLIFVNWRERRGKRQVRRRLLGLRRRPQ